MDQKRKQKEPPFDICQRTFEFALRIVKFCTVLDRSPGVRRALAKQLLRSGTSIGANVEEGQAGQSRADFVSKYCIARKEARETKYWLRLLIAAELHYDGEIVALVDESEQLKKILTSIIKNSQKN
jgi:four helix bundle protein